MSDTKIPGLKAIPEYYSTYYGYVSDLANVYSHDSNDKCYIFCVDEQGYPYVLDCSDEMQGVEVLLDEGYTLLSSVRRYRIGNMYAQCTTTFTTYAPTGGDPVKETVGAV